MTKRFVLSCFLVLSLACTSVQAQQIDPGPGLAQPASGANNANRTISFSGTVPGQPDGALPVSFFIYSDQQSAAALWSETQTVQVTGGRYSALLGSENPKGIPPELFAADSAHWLGVEVNGKEQRFLLVSVPYAMKAIDAERLGGLLPSEFVTAQGLQAILQKSATTPLKQPPAMPGQFTGPVPAQAAAGTPPS
ncbi:MAG: hypothetical protein LAP21_20580 [Acidobacteriia bacterium]|nr:hypothetical protein [Terriglobia bacterium]